MPLALLSSSVCFLLSLSVPVLHSFQVIFASPSDSAESEDTISQWVKLCFSLYAWEGGGLGPPGYFQFSKEIVRLERETRNLPSALAMNCLLLPVPAGEDPMTGIGFFALGLICSACPPASWLEHHCTTQLPELSLALLVR